MYNFSIYIKNQETDDYLHLTHEKTKTQSIKNLPHVSKPVGDRAVMLIFLTQLTVWPLHMIDDFMDIHNDSPIILHKKHKKRVIK